MRGSLIVVALCCGLVSVIAARPAAAQGVVAEDTRAFSIAGGSLLLEAPAGWKRVQPKSGIVETEFSIPSAPRRTRPPPRRSSWPAAR
jgi:hypothetical protein